MGTAAVVGSGGVGSVHSELELDELDELEELDELDRLDELELVGHGHAGGRELLSAEFWRAQASDSG